MTSSAEFKSDAFAAVHSAAAGVYRARTINKATMRDFDETCLAVAPAIKQLRESNSPAISPGRNLR